jgi:hypothetical protein
MRRLLLATTALLALAIPAKADIIIDTNGQGGTGDNVIFNSIASTNLVLGTLNGQHDEIVRFRDLSGNGNFTGSAGQNGNDIKIFNTSDLDISVYDSTNTTQLGITREIFSLKGDGNVFFHLTALESDGSFKIFNFGGYALGPGQSGFDFQAINGERIWDFDVVNVGGTISDFEHYRIDVQPFAVPGPTVGEGLPGLLLACVALYGFNRYRRNRREGGFDAAMA